MNWFTLAYVTMLLTLAVSNACDAQSMFKHRQPSHINMFADLQARRVGDLLTIVIRENTEVENKDERKGNKNTDIGGIFQFNGSTSGNGGTNTAAASLDSNTTSKRIFNGKSEYSVESALQDRITVQVLDVLPNGGLVVGGKRRRIVSGEIKTLVASGVVRPFDIRSDNTVESPFVANLELAFHGEGPESSFSNQGWLGKVTNKIWPF